MELQEIAKFSSNFLLFGVSAGALLFIIPELLARIIRGLNRGFNKLIV